MVRKIIIVILGPTAVGKTDISISIAEKFECEIISVDSKQIYKLMDIGTAKPPREVRERIPHHLIDIVFPDEIYTVGDFCVDAAKLVESISVRGKVPLMVGGTALYYWLFLRNPISNLPKADHELREELIKLGKKKLYDKLLEVDPISANRIHPNDLQRIVRALEVFYLTGKPLSYWLTFEAEKSDKYEVLWLGLNRDRNELYERINRRVDEMISKGLVEEVRGLLDMGYSPDLPALRGHGYREICDYFKGKCSLERAIDEIKKDTRNYAKRQLTWFRKWKDVEWFHPDESDKVVTRVGRWLDARFKQIR
ncbi:MAG: tRNA dimethylallyltransferase [bacterium]|nr:tRNA dimethylallyltransferase [bacterium]